MKLFVIDKIKLSQNKIFLILLFLFFFSLIFRILWVNFESAWIDEAYSIQLSAKTIKEIIIGCINDQHPPLFYIILKFWMGNSLNVSRARFLSVLIGSITIIQVFFILRKLQFTNWKSIIIACLFISISPMHIWYSQEARMYIMLLFFALLSIHFYINIIFNPLQDKQSSNFSNWVLLILINIFSLYLHYFSIFLIIFEFIFFLYVIEKKWLKPKQCKFGLFSFFTIGLGFLPWSPVLINQFLMHKLAWISEPTIFSIIASINRLILGPIVVFLSDGLNVIVFLSFLVLVIFGIKKINITQNNDYLSYLFLVSWFFIPILLIITFSLFSPIFQFKQLIIVLVPAITITILTVGILLKKIGKILLLGLLVITFFSTIYQQINMTKDDWRGLTKYIEEKYEYGDLLFFNSSSGQLGFDLYNNKDVAIAGYPHNYDVIKGGWDGNIVNMETESVNLEKLKLEYQRIWYVQYYPDLWDPDELLHSWFVDNYEVKYDKSFGSILLKLFH